MSTGKTLTAIQITTAAAICTMLDLTGRLVGSRSDGFIHQEDVPAAGVPGKSVRPSLRQADNACAGGSLEGRGDHERAPGPARPRFATKRSGVLALGLGVAEPAFAAGGPRGALADYRRADRACCRDDPRRRERGHRAGPRKPSVPGGRCPERLAAARFVRLHRRENCAPPRPISAGW